MKLALRTALLTALLAALALTLASCAQLPGARGPSGRGPDPALSRTVGRVVLRAGGGAGIFMSTGFIYPYGGVTYFITTLHTVQDIKRKFGRYMPIMVELPDDPQNPVMASHVLSEPLEDSAVFRLGRSSAPPGLVVPYESPCPTTSGKGLTIIGYTDANSGGSLPDALRVGTLACGTRRGKMLYLGVRHRSPGDMDVLLVGPPLVEAGMSGSPVFYTGTRTLAGMVKGHAANPLAPGSAARLGAEQYSVVMPLDKTIARIMALKRR